MSKTRTSPWRLLLDSFGPIEEPRAPRAPHIRPRRLGGSRARLSQDHDRGLVASGVAIAAPLSPAERWRDLDLSSHTLDRISANDLIELLADVSPDVSRALWDFLRMCNPGYEAVVLRPSGSPAPAAAQQALAAMLATIGDAQGDLSIPIGRLFMGGFLRGGFLGELVLNRAGRQVLDLATPDPATLRWRQLEDPERGQVWQKGQMQRGRFVPLDTPTVIYLPIDPLPSSPQGRAPANPAIFPTMFALAMLHDVRRVVQQQGYPRLDIEVVIGELLKAMPEDIEPGTKEYQEWIDGVVDSVSEYYTSLEPDDAYVHTSVVKVNRPVGAVDGGSLGAIPKLIEVLERQAIRALKTMPLLMGVTDGVSEANANRQWDIHMAGIRSLQHLVENLLDRLLTLGLQAQGVPGVVKFRFAEVQAGQRERNARVQSQEIQNAVAMYEAGYISQDEAAQLAAGKAKADAPAPRRASPPTPATGGAPNE